MTRRQRAMQIENLEGYHISCLLLVTTSRKPSVTKSNYRDTNPGLRQPTYDTRQPTRQPSCSSFTLYCLQPPATTHLIATFCSCTASLKPCSSHLPYADFTQGSYQARLYECNCIMGFATRGPHWLYTWMLLPKASTTEQSFTPMGKLPSSGEP